MQGGALRSPGTLYLHSCPDLFPPLCALAACSGGTTTLIGGRGLRDKECDRIRAMAVGMAAMDRAAAAIRIMSHVPDELSRPYRHAQRAYAGRHAKRPGAQRGTFD